MVASRGRKLASRVPARGRRRSRHPRARNGNHRVRLTDVGELRRVTLAVAYIIRAMDRVRTARPLCRVWWERIAVVVFALLVLDLRPDTAHAQVFIASRPHPDFGIGPLFLSVHIGKDDVRPAHRPLIVTMTWSLVLPATRVAADIAQDLYLLWPGEVPGAPGEERIDPPLARQVRALGFRSMESGHLRLSGGRRSDLATGATVRTLAEAPFVTFRGQGSVRGARGATVIRIPWVPELSSGDWLVRLDIPVRDVVVSRPVPWLEDVFWGRWYVIALAFGDLESPALYPFYFAARDRIVPVARDLSLLVVDFADARHLRIDDIVPASARRLDGGRHEDQATISLALGAAQGLRSQLLTVDFTYAPQRLPARPLVISAALVILGGTLRWLFTPVMAWLGRTLRARVLLGPAAAGRDLARAPSPEFLAQIRPGETTYEDVRRLYGPAAEEQVNLLAGDMRTLVYRDRRVIPRRGWWLGWLATVRYWNVEAREVEITFDRDRARDIHTRVRRSRSSTKPPTR